MEGRASLGLAWLGLARTGTTECLTGFPAVRGTSSEPGSDYADAGNSLVSCSPGGVVVVAFGSCAENGLRVVWCGVV
jgi:hypothetical protein